MTSAPIPRFVRWLKLRTRRLFGRRTQETELQRELQFHFDMLVQENLATGMSPEEARQAAQREFGASSVYREECRDTWRPAILTGLLKDFTFAIRGLRRSPGFTAIATFTLALGIGVNATIFSFIREGLIQPLLRDRQQNLVALYNARVGPDQNFRGFSYPELQALRETDGVFDQIAAQSFTVAAVGRTDDLQRRFICFTSDDYFSVLGARPYEGRFFTAEESQPSASIPVVVANYALWKRLGQPDDFVGSTIRVNQSDYTVVGIAPPGFAGMHVTLGPDVWLPLGVFDDLVGRDILQPATTSWSLIGRLQPGLTLDTARQRLAAVDRQLNTVPALDDAGPRRVVIDAPLRSELGSIRPMDESHLTVFAAIALGLSLLVLLVACLNLANMFLARGAARQKEIAIRLALGASRWRVIRALLAEGLFLSLAGGALGLVFSFWGDHILIQWAESSSGSSLFALGWDSFFDTSIVLATLAFSLIATAIFSLWPALRVTRLDLNHDLKQVAGKPAEHSRRMGFFARGNASIVIQIALSLALLFSAALFVRSSSNALTLDLGFRADNQLVANVDYSFLELDANETRQRQQALLAAVERLPGVDSAALAENAPYSFGLAWRPVRVLDAVADAPVASPQSGEHWSGYTAVTRDYFSTMGITLLRGRTFTDEESAGTGDTRPVAIIDETLAYRLFGDADPIGRRITSARSPDVSEEIEIVGVVRRFRNDVFETRPPPRFFRPFGQVNESTVYVHIRTSQPLALAASVRRALREADPGAPLLSVRPMSDYVEQHINMLLVRLAGVVFGIFGAIALLLAVVGVYGVKAYAVARRTREIGVRMALGARPSDVMSLIMKQGAIQTAVGVSLGLLLAFGAGRVLSRMLYSVDPSDPVSIIISAALLSAAVLLACWVPARRATKVDPIQTLRAE